MWSLSGAKIGAVRLFSMFPGTSSLSGGAPEAHDIRRANHHLRVAREISISFFKGPSVHPASRGFRTVSGLSYFDMLTHPGSTVNAWGFVTGILGVEFQSL